MLLALVDRGQVNTQQCTGPTPVTQSYLAQNVNNDEMEKPSCTHYFFILKNGISDTSTLTGM
jgi:hypothetical protein